MEQSLPIYGRLLCNMLGLQFSMGGSTAWSSGGKINLPALPYDNPRARKLGYGMIMHESGHEADTDYEVWPQHDPVLASMANRLEDIRIEKNRIKAFTGAKKRLQEMTEGLIGINYWKGPTDQDSPATLLGMSILYRLRASVLEQSAVAQWGEEAHRLLKEKIPPHLADHLLLIAATVTQCENTKEVVDLAASILQVMQEEKEKLDQQNQQGQGQQQQGQGQQQGQPDPNGQGGNQDPATNGQGGAASNQKGKGKSKKGKTPSQDPSSNPGQGSQKGTGQNEEHSKNISSILAGENDKAPVDAGKDLAEALNAIHQQSGSNTVVMPKATVSQMSLGEKHEIISSVMSISRALQTRAHRLFEATATKKRSYREEGRRFDPTRLWRPKAGDYRVFIEKTQAVRVNTAVQILLDISNSMKTDRRHDAANKASLAMAMALSKINGISVASATFPMVGAKGDSDNELVSVLHDFGQRPEQVADRYTAALSNAYTPTPEAMLWAGMKLLDRKEDRKILFVITDGIPERSKRGSTISIPMTCKIREDLESAGIEVIGIGIQIAIGRVFPKSIQVNDLGTLSGELFQLMNKVVLKKAA